MQAEEIIYELKQSGTLSRETIAEIEENGNLRLHMVQYFDEHKNREFVLDFLRILTGLRRDPDAGISGDSLMLACYLLGKHNHVEDCMEIWEAKQIDFDTYCYIDIQLIPFAGVRETIEYLKTQTSEEAGKALVYVTACSKARDFDDLERYHKEVPWYV